MESNLFLVRIFYVTNFKILIYIYRFNFPDITPGAAVGYKCKNEIFELCLILKRIHYR